MPNVGRREGEGLTKMELWSRGSIAGQGGLGKTTLLEGINSFRPLEKILSAGIFLSAQPVHTSKPTTEQVCG